MPHPPIDARLARQVKILPAPANEPPALAFQAILPDGAVYCAYRFPHPAVAATVVLRDPGRDAYLLIQRDNEPYRGHYAFPGGFLDVGRESIEETAARELREETGVIVAVGDLRLVDVRSAPDRDPRDHVFDIGYYAEVTGAEAHAGDETRAIVWARAEEIDKLPLAFDHAQLWRQARALAIGRPARRGGRKAKA